jgi:hypothetical protein
MKDHYIDQYGIDSLSNLKVASQTGCSFFLTLNEELLKDKKELEKIFNIKIITPNDEGFKELEDSGGENERV